MKLLALTLVVLALVSSGLERVGAVGGEGFSLSPLSMEAVLEPGGRYTEKMTIRNVGSDTLHLNIYACDIASREGENNPGVYVRAEEPEAYASKWLSVNPQILQLEPNQTHQIDVVLEVPADAAAGSYRGVVFAESVPNPSGAAQVGNRIGMLTFFSVGGENRFSVEMDCLNVKNWWMSSPTIELSVHNDGDIHQSLTGYVEIYQNEGMLRELALDKVIVQPQETRTISIPWPDAPRLGIFQASVRFNEGNPWGHSRERVSFILFPLLSAAGFILFVASIQMFRSSRNDPLLRMKKPRR